MVPYGRFDLFALWCYFTVTLESSEPPGLVVNAISCNRDVTGVPLLGEVGFVRSFPCFMMDLVQPSLGYRNLMIKGKSRCLFSSYESYYFALCDDRSIAWRNVGMGARVDSHEHVATDMMNTCEEHHARVQIHVYLIRHQLYYCDSSPYIKSNSQAQSLVHYDRVH